MGWRQHVLWPLKDDVGLVKPHFIFDGPIQTLSLNHLSKELQEKCVTYKA